MDIKFYRRARDAPVIFILQNRQEGDEFKSTHGNPYFPKKIK